MTCQNLGDQPPSTSSQPSHRNTSTTKTPSETSIDLIGGRTPIPRHHPIQTHHNNHPSTHNKATTNRTAPIINAIQRQNSAKTPYMLISWRETSRSIPTSIKCHPEHAFTTAMLIRGVPPHVQRFGASSQRPLDGGSPTHLLKHNYTFHKPPPIPTHLQSPRNPHHPKPTIPSPTLQPLTYHKPIIHTTTNITPFTHHNNNLQQLTTHYSHTIPNRLFTTSKFQTQTPTQHPAQFPTTCPTPTQTQSLTTRLQITFKKSPSTNCMTSLTPPPTIIII